jgi:hypothetical protein
MKSRDFLAVLLLFLPVGGFAQNLSPGKDLAFAQIAAGGGYETVLNITNRGTTAYAGTLSLFRASGQAWNPLVNGNTIAGGKIAIALGPGATATLRITGSGAVEAGFGVIKASGMEQTSFVEGTLTYYVRFGGKLADSIGVQPSKEIYLTTIPFDDFSTIALALANVNSGQATVQLKLFSDTNVLVSSLTPPLQLQPNQHIPQYLWQFFPTVTMTRGRLEIQSDLPILGTALTDAGGQFSSLPLLPGVKAYTVTSNLPSLSVSTTGEMSLWVDGPYVEMYERNLTENGKPPTLTQTLHITGQLVNGVVALYLPFQVSSNQEMYEYIVISPFSLSPGTRTGSIMVWQLNPYTFLGKGTLSLTPVD